MVITQSDLPNEQDLYVSLVNSDSAFVKKRPYLQDCLTAAQCDAMDWAVANRAAILTQYYQLPVAQHPPVPPLLSPANAKKDCKKGFSIAFSPEAATIKTKPLLQLQMAPQNVCAAL